MELCPIKDRIRMNSLKFRFSLTMFCRHKSFLIMAPLNCPSSMKSVLITFCKTPKCQTIYQVAIQVDQLCPQCSICLSFKTAATLIYKYLNLRIPSCRLKTLTGHKQSTLASSINRDLVKLIKFWNKTIISHILTFRAYLPSSRCNSPRGKFPNTSTRVNLMQQIKSCLAH